MTLRDLGLVFICLLLAGCASYFKRKECEKMNWFEHGQKVALRGERLNADSTLDECRKVEAQISESQLDLGFKSGMQKYCSPETSYQTGRNGDRFSKDLCDGPEIKILLSQYNKGVRDYCSPANSYQAGASGKKYLNLCPPELEKDFFPGYRKGRKNYVEVVIQDKEKLILEKERESNELQSEKLSLISERNRLDSRRSDLQRKRTYTATENQFRLDTEINDVDSDLRIVSHKISSKDSDISSNLEERQKIRSEISELRAEQAALDAAP